MSTLMAFVAQVLHLLVVMVAAPTLAGLSRVLADRLAGRDGPPLLQPWWELARLMRKQPVIAENASVVTRYAPQLVLTVTLVTAMLAPGFTLGMALAPLGDTLTIAGLLVWARLALLLAATDAGTAEGGVAAIRASRIAFLAEPALLLVLLGLSALAGTGNLDAIIDGQRDGGLVNGAAIEMAIAALAILVWAAVATPPLDAAFSGRDLAMVHLSDDVRRVVWFTLVTTIAVPAGIAPPDAGPLAWALGLLAWVVRLTVASGAMAGIGLLVGRTDARRAVGVAALLGGLALVLSLAGAGPA